MKNSDIAIIGLGYVGLPLSIEFAKKYNVLGFDINETRLSNLRKGIDRTNEVDSNELQNALSKGLKFSSCQEELRSYNVYIVTVPTPVNDLRNPDLSFLLKASKTLGEVLKFGDLVIYESTVYPGCTEEECVPILEKYSGLKFNHGFFCGYSPERINPGDKVKTLTKIKKVTSGSTPEVAEYVDQLYSSIIEAGTYKATNIKVAEASKAIENAQRDVNISFMNEMALIFDRLGIDTMDVIDAASTKWNFQKFQPGLVGGHCIGVDPYYLSYKAEKAGYIPQVLLSGRKVNDEMGRFIAKKALNLLKTNKFKYNESNVLILGYAFKENSSDTRNTKVNDVVKILMDFGVNVEVYDPIVQQELQAYDFIFVNDVNYKRYQMVILAVAHDCFLELDLNLFKKNGTLIYDTKSVLPRELVDLRL